MTNTTSLKDQIKKLVDIQAVDVDVYRLKTELQEKPAEIAALQAEFETKKANLKKLEENLKALLVKQKEYEVDLKSKEDGIIKADGQLSQLKTNKEYTAKLHEIESIKADKSLVEEKILVGMDQIESARKAIEEEKKVVAEEEKGFLARKKVVDDEVAVANDQLKVKESQRNRLTPDIRPDILSRYERLVQNKEGLGIVAVKNNSCQGCFMHMTEQTVNQIRLGEQLVNCDMCARILYLEEEL